jgi:hypothetical protein
MTGGVKVLSALRQVLLGATSFVNRPFISNENGNFLIPTDKFWTMPDGLQNPLRTRNVLTACPLYGLSDSKRKRFKRRFRPNKG